MASIKKKSFVTLMLLIGLLTSTACDKRPQLKVSQVPLPALPKNLTDECKVADANQVKSGEINSLKKYTYETEAALAHCKIKHKTVVEIYNCFSNSKTIEDVLACINEKPLSKL